MSDKLLTVPSHVGIIMDGNGRWATAHGHKRSYGHKIGAQNIQNVAFALFEQGVEYISLYAFSTENFNRPKQEVNYLFELLKSGIKKYGELCLSHKVKLVISGEISALDSELQAVISNFTNKTKHFVKPVLNICLNYGARQELCHAFNLLIQKGVKVACEKDITSCLYADLPPLDLIIRPGGEKRLSNFMLWQAYYAEIYFCDILWPDFNKEECLKALEWFASRKRRFGNV